MKQVTITSGNRSYHIQEVKSGVYAVIGPKGRKVKVLTYQQLCKLYPTIKSEIRKHFG